MGESAMVVILSEAKNLIISTESSIEILRLAPQNDITTQPLAGEDSAGGPICFVHPHPRPPPSKGEGYFGKTREYLHKQKRMAVVAAPFRVREALTFLWVRLHYRILFIERRPNWRKKDRMKGPARMRMCVISTLAATFLFIPMVSLAQQVVEIYNPAGVRADGVYIDKLLKKTMAELGKTRPPQAGNFPDTKIEKVQIKRDVFSEVNELFYKRGWGDGLPIVPPTKERVEEMLKGSDLSPEFLITYVDPMGGQATVEKIAVNAVMAGCRPEYMPVLMAATEVIMDPNFNLRGMATTTNPDIPMIILGGPIVKQLEVNYGTNALGRGWKANATISRGLHLIIQNIGGSWPGVTDMSTLGQPGEFAMMLAENADVNPWPPLHMELGHPKAANVVTVIGAEGTHNILGIGQTTEGYLKLVADCMAGMDRAARSMMLLIIAQDTAEMLAREGWTREKMRQFISKHGVMPFSKYKERFIDTNMARVIGGVPSWVFETKDPNAMIPVPFIDQFLILVAGGPGEKSMLIPGWAGSKAISKEIRLPANWQELLEKAKN
jgi:hypothetical protein